MARSCSYPIACGPSQKITDPQGGYVLNAVTADGSNDYLTLSDNVSDTNTKQGHLAMFVKLAGSTGYPLLWSGYDAPGGLPLYQDRVNVSLAAVGGGQSRMRVQLRNTSNTLILDTLGVLSVIQGAWNFVGISWDLENDLFSNVINSQFGTFQEEWTSADAKVTTYSNDTPGWSQANLTRIYRTTPNVSPSQQLNGDVCNFSVGQNYIDWTDSAKRDEYYVANASAAPSVVNPSEYTDSKVVQLTSNAANYGNNDAGDNFSIVGAFVDATPPEEA